MCLALANGSPPEAPRGRLRRIWLWIGFGILLGRLVAAGL